MDEDVRERFHELSNHVHRVESRVLVAEGQIKVLERAMDKAATSAEVQSLRTQLEQQLGSIGVAVDLKLDLVRKDIAAAVESSLLVKRAVLGMISVVLVAVIGAWMKGILH